MGYLQRSDLAFHYALADEFTICDNYFSSAAADTAINRIYLWSGTSDPRNILGQKRNGPGLAERPRENGYTWVTYPERLEAAGVTWKVYQGGTGEPGSPTDNYTDNSLEFFAKYQIGSGADPCSPLIRKGVSQHTLKELRGDVVAGRLPQVSWIVAPFKYCEHPSASAVDGAYYVDRVMAALTSNVESWSKTVLFLCYDENDGLFDHVVPAMPPLTSHPDRDGMVSPSLVSAMDNEVLDLDIYTSMNHPLIPGVDPGGKQPIGLGIRVPMIVISPWTRGGWVCSQTFDHTSILRFLEKRFDVPEPNISAWRRAVCGDLTSAFDFTRQPLIFVPHIDLPGGHRNTFAPIMAPVVPVVPTQEPGVRPSRPLPYRWRIKSSLDDTRHLFLLTITNYGDAGAAFYAYDHVNRKGYPRRYTVAAGERIVDRWLLSRDVETYDIMVYGPNGYLCHTRGVTPSARVEVQLRYDHSKHKVHVGVINSDGIEHEVLVGNAYLLAPVKSLKLKPNSIVECTYDTEANYNWYDITVMLVGVRNYLRRFAGHLECGSPSISDPGPLHLPVIE